jgi:ATP-dependent Lhr-like helicase
MFGTHWRWNATIALAIPRSRNGQKMPPQLQRMMAEDLLAAAFPDAAACLENIPGDREISDHPLVRQTIDDCINLVMDLPGLKVILEKIRAGEIQCVARDLPEPSPLAAEILNARPYAFLDDAPAEERRTLAVYTRRAFEASNADDLGVLDASAIERVRGEAWPDIRDADELHDALLTSGYLLKAEVERGGADTSWMAWWEALRASGRATSVAGSSDGSEELCVATERLAEVVAVRDPSDGAERETAIRELLRGRVGILGPTTGAALAASLGVEEAEAEQAMIALEAEGVILRGRFTPDLDTHGALEWCERGLLARIHRYTLNRLRAEIEPVSTGDFMRFLLAWQRVDAENHATGLDGLASVVEQLDGFEVPAGAWETEVLSARCEEYVPTLLDTLCLTGRVAWGRLSDGVSRTTGGGPIRTSPIALCLREHLDEWLSGRPALDRSVLSSIALPVLEVLERRGASFLHEIVSASGLLVSQVEQGLAELAGLGVITSDGFAGLRALITPSHKRKPLGGGVRRHRTVAVGIESAGRWSLLQAGTEPDRPERMLAYAWTLLHRYGIVFRRLLDREANAPAWRDLLMVYRRLEARGEIRGGRFVAEVSGEQFALPGAVGQLRSIRRSERTGTLVSISAADPLNLTGIVTPGDRIPALAGNRVLYEDGVPALALVAGEVKPLGSVPADRVAELKPSLIRRPLAPALRAHFAMSGVPGASLSVTERGRSRRRRRPQIAESSGEEVR